MAVIPFHIRYDLTRGRRLGPFLHPWLPCLAPCFGFAVGMVILAAEVTPWFLAALALPAAVCRNFVVGLVRILRRRVEPVEVTVDAAEIEVRIGAERTVRPLDGVIQVFRTGDVWTVLHRDGPALAIPVAAVTAEQVEYLKGVARQAAARRATA